MNCLNPPSPSPNLLLHKSLVFVSGNYNLRISYTHNVPSQINKQFTICEVYCPERAVREVQFPELTEVGMSQSFCDEIWSHSDRE